MKNKNRNLTLLTFLFFIFSFFSLKTDLLAVDFASPIRSELISKPLIELSNPKGFYVNSNGDIYVADSSNNQIKIYHSNTATWTTLGSFGSGLGQFNQPAGINLDSNGNIFVADTYNNRIQKYDIGTTTWTSFGVGGTGAGQFSYPGGVYVDSTGNIYVSDTENDRLQKYDIGTTTWTSFGVGGTGAGQFSYPGGVYVDSTGNIYVADSQNDRIQKYDIGTTTWSALGSYGTGLGQFVHPNGIHADSTGNIYVVDNSDRIQKYDIGTTTWSVIGGSDYLTGEVDNPYGVQVDSNNNIYVLDTGNNRVQKFTASNSSWSVFGDFTEAGQVVYPEGINIDSNGNLYVVDSENSRIEKYDINTGVWTIIGLGTGGTAPGDFRYPDGIAFDSSGNLYIADTMNSRIQKYDGNVWTIFGTGGTGPGQFNRPHGVAVDSIGNIFVTDSSNDRIQKYDIGTTTWSIISNDCLYGICNPGEFIQPYGIDIDSSNNVYVTDSTDDVIQKYDGSTWTVISSSGTGPGQFNGPTGIMVDSNNNIYVSDSGNDRIQRYDIDSDSWTVFGSYGDTLGTFNSPEGIVVDSLGNVYVSDGNNNRVQKIVYFDSLIPEVTPDESDTILARSNIVAPGYSSFDSVSTDSLGNIYAVGRINGDQEYDFGNGVTITGSSVFTNAVIVKYNSNGQAQWAKTAITAPSYSAFNSVFVDSSNNIYAVGTIGGNSQFDFDNSVTVTGNSTITNSVIVKYNTDGVAQWAKSTVVAPDQSVFNSVYTDSLGNIYTVGNIYGNGQFDFGNDITVTGNSLYNNAFILKYNSAGVVQWAKAAVTAPGESFFSGLAIDSSDNIYAAGNLQSTGQFDFGNSVTVTGSSDNSSLIVKYNTDGVAQWAKTTLSGPDSLFYRVAVDLSGNVYGNGKVYTTSQLDFGNGVTVSAGGEDSILTVKYNSNGVAQWAKSTLAGSADSKGYGISTDYLGNVYIVGDLYSNGPYYLGNDITLNGGYSSDNIFIIKYNSDGQTEWAKSTLTAADDSYFNNVITDSTGNIYAVGQYSLGAYDFGSGVTLTNSSSSSNALLIKYAGEVAAEPTPTPTNTPGSTPTPTPSPVVVGGSNVTSNQSSNNIDHHSCNNPKPFSFPNLFQINASKTSAKVFFSPLSDTNQYFISFSEKPNAEEHGAQMVLAKEGVQNITIDKLKPNTTYYVKVRGQIGCMPGDWSNTMKFTTSSYNKIFYKNLTSKIGSLIKNLVSKPKTETILPKSTINNESAKPTPQTTIVPPQTSSNSSPTNSVPETKQKKCFLWWCW